MKNVRRTKKLKYMVFQNELHKMMFQILLRGECYANVYTSRSTDSPLFRVLLLGFGGRLVICDSPSSHFQIAGVKNGRLSVKHCFVLSEAASETCLVLKSAFW
jgi:hypothetical protein